VCSSDLLGPKDFLLKSMPELSHRGTRRDLFVPLKGFRIVKKGDGFITLRFSLPKGAYATSALRAIFGP
jgi:tRNA(Glu) U13 pseudouridine synthase TruD